MSRRLAALLLLAQPAHASSPSNTARALQPKAGATESSAEGLGYCTTGTQIYKSGAWELTNGDSSGGTDTSLGSERYMGWVELAVQKCLEMDAATEYVSVWYDAGYRCYKYGGCSANGNSLTYTWGIGSSPPPADTTPVYNKGLGHCTTGTLIYRSIAWELTNGDSSGGKDTSLSSERYMGWVELAVQKCLEKDAATEFVSVWSDAGYRCYKNGDCSANGYTDTYTWGIGDNNMPSPPPAPTTPVYNKGLGHCTTGTQIYGSGAWELTSGDSSGGTDTSLGSERYMGWVELAVQKCLEMDAATEYVSVWYDAGYRCYKYGGCSANGNSLTYTWGVGDADPPSPPAAPAAPSTTASFGLGNCDNAHQVYASGAWELTGGDSSVGTDITFATAKYLAWKDLAAEKCLEKDAATDYVSVWFDAGYRCYKGGCTSGPAANGHSLTFTWKLVPFPPTPPPPASPPLPPPSGPPSTPPAAAPISVHGDPMFKTNGTGTHFWLKDGVLTPLLLWRSSDGNHTLELSGRTFAREATGDQWFKQMVVAVDGTKLLDVATRSDRRAHEGPMRVTRPLESKLPTGIAEAANIDVADDLIKVEANGVYFEVRPAEAAKFSGKAAKAQYEHLNVHFDRGIPATVGASGLFAQLAGIEPMLASTKEMLVRPAPQHRVDRPRVHQSTKPVQNAQKKLTRPGVRAKKP